MYIPDHAGELDFYGRKTRKFPIYMNCFESAFICAMIGLIFEQKYHIANALSKQFVYILNHPKKLDFIGESLL
jgi:hypothetical protein